VFAGFNRTARSTASSKCLNVRTENKKCQATRENMKIYGKGIKKV
jgi:hypothetical protein